MINYNNIVDLINVNLCIVWLIRLELFFLTTPEIITLNLVCNKLYIFMLIQNLFDIYFPEPRYDNFNFILNINIDGAIGEFYFFYLRSAAFDHQYNHC